MESYILAYSVLEKKKNVFNSYELSEREEGLDSSDRRTHRWSDKNEQLDGQHSSNCILSGYVRCFRQKVVLPRTVKYILAHF